MHTSEIEKWRNENPKFSILLKNSMFLEVSRDSQKALSDFGPEVLCFNRRASQMNLRTKFLETFPSPSAESLSEFATNLGSQN